MTSEEHITQRDTVRMAEGMESSHDRHNCPPIRKPVLCSICEAPSSHGPACDGCADVLRVTYRVTYDA